jgi:hypothetical protein
MIAELEWDELNNLYIFQDGYYTYVSSYRDDLHVIFNPKKVGEYGLMYVGEEDSHRYYLAYELMRYYFLGFIPLWKYRFYATVKEMIPVIENLMFDCKEVCIKLPSSVKETLDIPYSFSERHSYY